MIETIRDANGLEWDEYDECLWDARRAEVRSMVRKFYEQADADMESKQERAK